MWWNEERCNAQKMQPTHKRRTTLQSVPSSELRRTPFFISVLQCLLYQNEQQLSSVSKRSPHFFTPFSKQQQGISQTMTPSWFFPVCLVLISCSQLNVKMFEYPLGTTQKTRSLWSRYCKIHSSLSFSQRHFDITFVLTDVSDNDLIVCYFWSTLFWYISLLYYHRSPKATEVLAVME